MDFRKLSQCACVCAHACKHVCKCVRVCVRTRMRAYLSRQPKKEWPCSCTHLQPVVREGRASPAPRVKAERRPKAGLESTRRKRWRAKIHWGDDTCPTTQQPHSAAGTIKTVHVFGNKPPRALQKVRLMISTKGAKLPQDDTF